MTGENGCRPSDENGGANKCILSSCGPRWREIRAPRTGRLGERGRHQGFARLAGFLWQDSGWTMAWAIARPRRSP